MTPEQLNEARAVADSDGRAFTNEDWFYLWKWVERGMFDMQTAPMTAIEALAFHPSAPWNQGCWDVDHKLYAEKLYSKFPKARPEHPNG